MKPPIQSTAPCPECAEPVKYVKRRARFYCDECELEFDTPSRAVEPQTIFLSYAHRSEREEDLDVSEDLVLLIQAELESDGHTVKPRSVQKANSYQFKPPRQMVCRIYHEKPFWIG